MQDDGRRDIARPTMGNKNRKYEFKKLFSLIQVLRACLSYKTAKINCFD